MELSQEQLSQLRKSLPEEAVSPHPTKNYLSTIKAIYVVERLNEVFGIGGWKVENEFIERIDKMVVVKARFTVEDIYIEAYGGNDNADLGDAYKGACTDALTKIGSYLEIGMDVFKGLATNTYISPRMGGKPQNAEKPRYEPPVASGGASDDDKPWITDDKFKEAIKKLMESGHIAAETSPDEAMRILRTRYKVAKKYKDMVQDEIFNNLK